MADAKELAMEAFALFKEMDYWCDRYNEVTSELRDLGYEQLGFIQEYMVNASRGMTTLSKAADVLELFHMGPNLQEAQRPSNPSSRSTRRKETYTDLRLKIGLASNWICIYCETQGSAYFGPDGRPWHVDHLFPQAKDGDSKRDNLILSCASCNLKKHTALASELLLKIKARLDREAAGGQV